MHLKCKEWKIFTRKQRLQKCPNGQVMANLRKVTQKPYFLKKCKAGTKRNFSKIAQEVPSFERFKALWSKRHYPVISIHLKCNDRKRFRRKQRLQKCKNGQDMGIFARSPKTPIFKKVQREDQGKFFKNRLKSSLRLKFSKGLWRK